MKNERKGNTVDKRGGMKRVPGIGGVFIKLDDVEKTVRLRPVCVDHGPGWKLD